MGRAGIVQVRTQNILHQHLLAEEVHHGESRGKDRLTVHPACSPQQAGEDFAGEQGVGRQGADGRGGQNAGRAPSAMRPITERSKNFSSNDGSKP